MKVIILFIATILLYACSSHCSCTIYNELNVKDFTMNPNNTKQLDNYYVKVYQFEEELELDKVKLCNLKTVNKQILGELDDMHNPQRLSFELQKNSIDTLFLEIQNKGYKISLNPVFNHYSIEIKANGAVQSVYVHKDEYVFFD